MIKLLSIVMPYYNRRQLLISTLRSIDYFKKDYPIEIIIVDDASRKDQQINDIPDLFPKITFRLITVERDRGQWRGACVAYNIGFSAVKGDAILINCPECLHVGDVLGYVFKNLKPKSYISFSTYDGNRKITKEAEDFNFNNLPQVIKKIQGSGGWWRTHTTNYTLIPYCAALFTKDMERLSGYDERFVSGIGYDDYDFTDRVTNLGLNTSIVDDPFILHLNHPAPVYSNTLNLDFLLSLRENYPDRIKADMNKVYIR